MSQEEQKYLEQYDITQFDRPSIATDIAVFSIMGRQSEADGVRDAENYRKLPEKKLKLLLIKRAAYPYKNHWALPGGFCRSNEDVYETARRELYEETHVRDVYLNLSGIYGDIGRDPRGWIISHTFLALMDGEKCDLKADTDAWEARWFDVGFEIKQKKKKIRQTSAMIENEYHLSLQSTDMGATNLDPSLSADGAGKGTASEADRERMLQEVSLSAVIREKKEYKNYHETVHYEIVKSDGFAFDHAKIITCAILALRQQTETDGKVVFDLMPELFTLTDLQRAFEIILDQKLLVANFRRKMLPYVVETEQAVEGAGHRPAKLFQRNVEMFYR